jgi:hypothetical protein
MKEKFDRLRSEAKNRIKEFKDNLEQQKVCLLNSSSLYLNVLGFH